MLARPAVVIVALLVTGRAEAHGLHAAHQVLPGKKIQIQGWYDTNEPASDATVQVLRADDTIVAEGRLDANGLWVFPFPQAEELRVVVRDGTAHQARLTIGAHELRTQMPWREMLTGIGFLLALGAFVLSMRNARELRALRRKSSL